jgi:long-chain acyl-CoA synthetase
VLDGPAAPRALIPDDMALLPAAFGGHGFRLGGTGPLAAGPGQFETLTGGTTAAPRRILRSQASWVASFAVDAVQHGIGPGVTVGVPGKLSHSLALYGALCGLHLGATVVKGAEADVLWATPAQLGLLTAPLPGLRRIVCGGGPFPPALQAQLARIVPQAETCVFYGTAETSFLTLASADEAASGLAGRAFPGVSLRVDAPEGRPGEISAASPYVAEGYASDPGPARWQDGRVWTGEWGIMAGGLLRLLGRAGRMVTVADVNVWPEAVEDWLLRQPGVAAAAALARPDARRGHVIEAAVLGVAEPAALVRDARAALGPAAAPRRILRLADWPWLPSGKTDLRAVEARMGWR